MLREIIFKFFQSVHNKAKESLIKEGKIPGMILVGLDPKHSSSFKYIISFLSKIGV